MDVRPPDPPSTPATGPSTAGRPVDLLIVVESFVLGGVASLFAAVAGAARHRGLDVVVVGLRGSAAEDLDWGGAKIVQVDAWDDQAATEVAALAARASRAVWSAAPPTLPVLIAGLSDARLAVVVHGPAELNRPWFGQHRLELLTALLQQRPTVRVLAPSADVARGLSELLAVPLDRFGTLTHVTPATRTGPATRPRERVVVPTRLSPEKRFAVRAGAMLAAHREVPLLVVGAGEDVAWVEELADEHDLDIELVRDADIHRHVTRDDVVVAVGLVALETARYAGAVVPATRAGGGRLVDVVHPDNVERLHAMNFLGGAQDDADPHAIWQRIDALTDVDREAVRDVLHRLSDPATALAELMSACEADRPSAEVSADKRLLRATASAWLRQSADDGAWIEELIRGRDWLAAHREEVETWVRELEKARDQHAARADELAARLHKLQADQAPRG